MKPSFLLGGLAALLFAQAGIANDNNVRKAVDGALKNLYGPQVKSDAVRKAGVANLYEVQIGGDILYTDEKANFLIIGDIINVREKKNLTEESKMRLSQVKFSDLPLDLAAKQVKGNGKRVLATFEDPNCTYCKKLAEELQKVTDVTIYTFVYPIFPQSGDVSRSIWCAPDRAKAWNDYVLKNVAPPPAKCDTAGMDRVLALGKRMDIRGTPAMIFADGTRVPGFREAAMLEKMLDKGSALVR